MSDVRGGLLIDHLGCTSPPGGRELFLASVYSACVIVHNTMSISRSFVMNLRSFLAIVVLNSSRFLELKTMNRLN